MVGPEEELPNWEKSMWDLLGWRFGRRILAHSSPLLLDSIGGQGDPWGNLPPDDSLEQKSHLKTPLSPPLPSNPRDLLPTEAARIPWDRSGRAMGRPSWTKGPSLFSKLTHPVKERVPGKCGEQNENAGLRCPGSFPSPNPPPSPSNFLKM